MSQQSTQQAALWSHLDPLLASFASAGGLGWVVPLVIWMTFRDRSAFVAEHAKESLNFQITLTIAMAASALLVTVLIGFLLIPAVAIVALIFMVQASLAGYRLQGYRYPLCFRFIK
jgi:uncharacterized Tic20 family protein